VPIQDKKALDSTLSNHVSYSNGGGGVLDSMEIDYALDPSIQEQYDIRYYGRFKDDIIIIAGARRDTLEFYRGLRERAGCFKLLVESISKSSCTVLDVSNHIVDTVDGPRCMFNLYKKH